MYAQSPDEDARRRCVDSWEEEETTQSEVSTPEAARPVAGAVGAGDAGALVPALLLPLAPAAASDSEEGSDSESSPEKLYHRPDHQFVSQESILLEDDDEDAEDYEVLSDHEGEEGQVAATVAVAAARATTAVPPLVDGAILPQAMDDEVSFEGDADDEGDGGSTEKERGGRRKGSLELQGADRAPWRAGESSSSAASGLLKTPMAAPTTPRSSHREQMLEFFALFERDHNRKKEHIRIKSGDSAAFTPRSTTLLKYIRKWGKEKGEGGTDIGGNRIEEKDDESVEREAGSEGYPPGARDEDNMSWDDSSSEWEYPSYKEVDWSGMPTVPLSFHAVHGDQTREKAPHYLDANMFSGQITTDEANRFAWEHGMLLQAVLQLLAERDQVGVEGSIDSGDNIWKKGPLKKLSFRGGKNKLSAQWKVKYVELRLGNLCYYEDNGRGRKMIHLRQADAEIKASASSKTHPGFVFELSVLGASTSYWMANSEEERQAWIKSIQSAMLGSVAPRRDVDMTLYADALAKYGAIRDKILVTQTREQLLAVLQSVRTIRVPAEWLRKQLDEKTISVESHLSQKHVKTAASAQRQLKSSIVEFWKKLDETTFSLNGITIPRRSPLAAERLVGALSRALLEYDRIVADDDGTIPELTELQAVSYARNILLSVIQNIKENHASSAVHHLLDNQNWLVLSSDHKDEHSVNLEVSPAGEELPDDLPLFTEELSGWLWMRRPRQPAKNRKRRYVVVSGGVLSYYEAALPRPSGLRGQFVLHGATIEEEINESSTVEEHYALTIHTQKGDLILSFENDNDLIDWRDFFHEQLELTQSAGCSSAFAENPTMLQVDEGELFVSDGFGAEAPIIESEYEGHNADSSLDFSSKNYNDSHAIRKSTILTNSASRLSRAAGKAAVLVSDTAGKVAETAGKVADTAGKAAGKVAGTAGKLTDEGIRFARGAISKTPGVNVVKGAVGRTVGRLRPGKGLSTEQNNRLGGHMARRPSLQMLLSNTALADKRETTIQCVVQTNQTFHVFARDNDHFPTGESWLTINAKLYQAFLFRGGPSGRMAPGDALIQLDFVERYPDNSNENDMNDDADYESDEDLICALPRGLWRPS